MKILPITRSKQLSSNNFRRLTPYKRFVVLLKHVFLLVRSSKHKISAQISTQKTHIQQTFEPRGENVNYKSCHGSYPIKKTKQLAMVAAVVSSALFVKSHQPYNKSKHGQPFTETFLQKACLSKSRYINGFCRHAWTFFQNTNK